MVIRINQSLIWSKQPRRFARGSVFHLDQKIRRKLSSVRGGEKSLQSTEGRGRTEGEGKGIERTRGMCKGPGVALAWGNTRKVSQSRV
jgi:hypothetical protein